MPDPIRVTRAVRRCAECEEAEEQAFQFRDWMSLDMGIGQGCENCSDGWVDVPVDEECEWCAGGSWAWRHPEGPRDCPHCGGSGRRLHDWATGWCVGDEALTHWIEDGRKVCAPIIVRTLSIDGECYAENNWEYEGPVTDLALVLSDPSHRPEPMRWKQ